MGKRRKKTPSSEKLALLPIIERFAGTRMLVVGDLILDHYVWGKVNRISPEAPVVVVRVTEENRRLGGAGNVVNNLVALGARVSVCGVVGSDEAGRQIVALLQESGVDTSGVVVDAQRQTTVKTRVIAHAQQVVRVDREVTKAVDGEVVVRLGTAVRQGLDSVSGVIVSDYAKGAVCPAALEGLFQEYRAGRLGYGKVPLLIDPKGPNYGIYDRATVMKPNRSEAEVASSMEISDRPSAITAAKKLLTKWNAEMILMTLGEEGMVLVSALPEVGESYEIDTVAQEVFDVSGAGDTVSAVFALALSVGAHPQAAAELANYGAGVVVGQVGTVAVSAAELAESVHNAA